MKNVRARSKQMTYLGLAAFASLVAASPVAAATGSFTGLGFLNPSFPSSTNPYVDADGTVVAGTSNYVNGLTRAFIWTSSGGIVALALLPRTNQSAAGGISANGKVIDGVIEGTLQGQRPAVAFRWTDETGTQAFNDQKEADSAFGLNSNGSVLAGNYGELVDNEGEEALRWLKGNNKAQLLGFLGEPSAGSGFSVETGMDFDRRIYFRVQQHDHKGASRSIYLE